MRNWVNQQTNVATSWRKVGSFEAPELIFCIKDPFKENASSMFVSKHVYDTQNAKYSVSIVSCCPFRSQNDVTIYRQDIPVSLSGNIPRGTTNIIPMNHEIVSYYTFYNGKCKSVSITDRIHPMDHVEFRYPKNLTDMKVYLLAKGNKNS